MLEISLKNGEIKDVAVGTTLTEIAKSLGENTCVAKINGELMDLRTPINQDCSVEFFGFESPEGKSVYWHTASHVLAHAVKRIFKSAKLAIGPAIESGFYYDFDLECSIIQEDLPRIEAEMVKIIKENLMIEKFELSYEEAIELMKKENQPYKIELIEKYVSSGGKLSFYKQGEFIDLCRGPHLISTDMLNAKAIKLTSCTGAYWKGDSKNKMLQRIYGVSFPSKDQLKAHLDAVEDAKRRDHNKIGRELEYFTTVDYIGQGLPILLPNGAKVIQILQRFVEDEEEKRGYQLTKTPFMAKSDLYKISGHWDHYKDSMFVLGNEEKDEEVFALRPMTCPFQFQVYLNKSRSYRDLPMRFNETSPQFRNEASGEMHGLIRVRQYTLSDGHIMCTPEQLNDEFKGCVDLIGFLSKTFGLENDITYRFSKWDKNNKEKYIGGAEEWERVQDQMREILNEMNIGYVEADGEAAFYGPKLDVQFKNVYGKEDTLFTVQIDFQLAKRFGMEYVDVDGQKKNPYVIHRASLGCYERPLAMLLEKHAGALPMWLMPEQIRILPINEDLHGQAKELQQTLKNAGIPRVTVDMRNEKIGYKIRNAQLSKIPYMIIFGNKESESGMVSVRSRSKGDLGSMSMDEFIKMASEEIESKK